MVVHTIAAPQGGEKLQPPTGKSLDQFLESYQGNAFPKMIDDLSGQLCASSDSISRLGIGWAPIVPFKKGPSFQGWWAIPERDENAKTIGLSLRSQDGLKVMYPGSKHGLIYEVNPDHCGGERGYDAGPQNWVRTMDAGLPCAVCGKPDGCLLSAENPADPKAVICRVEKSDRPMKFGYLHIRKPAGQIKTASALADNGKPVVVVEGMSDCAVAMDMGYPAVGRPSNIACMDKGLDWSDAEREGHRILAEQTGVGGRSEEQAERSDMASRLAQRIREGDQTAAKELGEAVRNGKLPTSEVESVIQRATAPQGIEGVIHRIREPHDLMRVWNQMTPQEKHQTAGTVIDRIADSTSLPADERQQFLARISEGVKESATASK